MIKFSNQEFINVLFINFTDNIDDVDNHFNNFKCLEQNYLWEYDDNLIDIFEDNENIKNIMIKNVDFFNQLKLYFLDEYFVDLKKKFNFNSENKIFDVMIEITKFNENNNFCYYIIYNSKCIKIFDETLNKSLNTNYYATICCNLNFNIYGPAFLVKCDIKNNKTFNITTKNFIELLTPYYITNFGLFNCNSQNFRITKKINATCNFINYKYYVYDEKYVIFVFNNEICIGKIKEQNKFLNEEIKNLSKNKNNILVPNNIIGYFENICDHDLNDKNFQNTLNKILKIDDVWNVL